MADLLSRYRAASCEPAGSDPATLRSDRVPLPFRAMRQGIQGTRADGAALIALTLTLLLAPLTAGVTLIEDPLVAYRVILAPSDLPLVALVGLVGWRAARSGLGGVGAGAAMFAILLALLALSFVLRPTPLGAQTVYRALGTLAIAMAVARLAAPAERSFLWGTLALAAALQSALVVAQIVTGHPLGVVGEAPNPLSTRDASVVPRGTFLHPYVLAGSSLVIAGGLLRRGLDAKRAAPWYVAAALAAIPAGVTYSRAAALGSLAGMASLARGGLSRPIYRGAVLAVALGAILPALLWSGGWWARTEEGTSAPYRDLLQDQAAQLIAEHPFLGVGTGRYVAAARERFPDPPRPVQPVHSVPVLVAAEAGLAAGALVVALLVVVGWRATRSGPAATALFLMFVPYVLVDAYPYLGVQGPVVFGLWIGSLDLCHRLRDLSPEPA